MKTLSLAHLVHQPILEEDAPPLLLLLHGVGSNEHDLIALAPFLDKRFLIISARAPNTLEPGSYAWFDVDFTPQGPIIDPAQAEASRKALIAFLDEAVTAYGADPKQVYLMGFSQGASVCYALLSKEPELMMGVAGLAGFLPEPARQWLAPGRLAGKQVFIAHGTVDETVPVAQARAARDDLARAGAAVAYHEYDGVGHKLNAQGVRDLTQWLAARLGAG